MNTKNLIFKLNDTEKIVVELSECIEHLHCCYEAPVVLQQGDNRIFLVDDNISHHMYEINDLLKKALNNKLKIHKSITKDIGFLYNEEAQNKPGFVYKKLEGIDYWVGNRYGLFSPVLAKGNLTSWIYNDANG